MKTLIFSDTHLSDRFDIKKYEFLKRKIESADFVIINGDFWDNSKINFSTFVNSKWKKLFPLLKEKKTVYIFGNHDLPHQVDHQAMRFSDKQLNFYELKINNKKIRVEHGHNLSVASKAIYKLFKNKPILLSKILFPIGILFHFNEIITNKYDISPLKILNYKFKKMNRNKNAVLIMGHTHSPEYKFNENYINQGFIRKGFGSYIWIENKEISLLKEHY